MEKIFLIDKLDMCTDKNYARLLSSCPEQKQQEIIKKKQNNARLSSAAGYALLQHVLIQYYDVPKTTDILFTTAGKFGKPIFIDKTLPYFNLSHSQQIVALVTGEQPLGIDVERVQQDTFGIAQMFHPREAQMLRMSDDKATTFTAMWTTKEAYTKNHGLGINENILKRATFKNMSHYVYEQKKFSVMTYKDHIISVYGNNFYPASTIDVVPLTALL